MAQNVTIYFDTKVHGDLKSMIDKLKSLDPRFQGRSRSEVARMLLLEKLSEELKTHGTTES